jgi:hypothetical protein
MIRHTTNPTATDPTWVAATTPPSGANHTVVSKHGGILTTPTFYAGTSGFNSGFFISSDNAVNFSCD